MPGCIRGGSRLAGRPEGEAQPGPAKHKPGHHPGHHGQVDERGLLEQHRSEPWDVGERPPVHGGQFGPRRPPNRALSEVGSEADTQDGQRQARHNLIGSHHHGEQAV